MKPDRLRPKNALHWKGIDRSIRDISAGVPPHFVVAAGIAAVGGNGPLHGSSRKFGRIELADDPVAADFTCARLMGLNPLPQNRRFELDMQVSTCL
jgi:uncharacterized protein (DUF362 family)